MKKWIEPEPVVVPDAVLAAVDGQRLVAERLVRQGIRTASEVQQWLDPDTYTPADPYDLPDMAQAVERVQQAIDQQQSILVWGDFDVDGQTATALLFSALRDVGANVRYHVPNRLRDGHGIQVDVLRRFMDEGVTLLLTCDTGVAAHEALDYARSCGIDVVVTDHHALPEALPVACAVVNPMRLPEAHPMHDLPGVGVAYQLIRALYGEQSSAHLLDLVALGIVADVMVLTADTRYWLQRGLVVLREAMRPGLRAIMERAEINPAEVSESDIGFALAPRLNAIGRLADANPAVELLTTADERVIAERVNELEGLNQLRRFYTQQIYSAAEQQITADPSLLEYAALVVMGEGWHTGVVGIVASRLAEIYQRPVMVLSSDGDVARGSARSVVGCDLVTAIRTQADLLLGYGGHTMAAGLSLPVTQVPALRRGLSLAVRQQLGAVPPQPELVIDGYISLVDVGLDFADDVGVLAPFGNGNPPLTLVTRQVKVKSRRTLGRRQDHLSIQVVDEADNEQRVIWWSGSVADLPTGWFDLAYTVRPNVFNGRREALLEWLDCRIDPAQASAEADATGYEVLDYRQRIVPSEVLATLQQQPNTLVWCEGPSDLADVTDRQHLTQAQTLIVWHSPPSVAVWQTLLAVVQPQQLVVCGHDAPLMNPNALLKYVIGLLKFAVQHKGAIADVPTFAARTGHTEDTIHAALRYIQAEGVFELVRLSPEQYSITAGGLPDDAARKQYLQQRLVSLLRETHTYQRYWLQQAL